jgi:hypothetical protein
MNTSAQIVEVNAVAVAEQRASRGLAGLAAALRRLLSNAASQPKDQDYSDYLETMAVLTGF